MSSSSEPAHTNAHLSEESAAWESGISRFSVRTDRWSDRALEEQTESAGGRTTNGRPIPFGLTAREVEVLRLIGEGQSVPAIAEALSYSESTIKKAIHVAMAHLGAKNRTHAVAVAIREKIIQ